MLSEHLISHRLPCSHAVWSLVLNGNLLNLVKPTCRVSCCSVHFRRQSGQPMYMDTVQGLQRELTDLETTLDRLMSRDAATRDRWWEQEVTVTRHDTTRHDTTRHDTTRHDTTRHDTTRHDTTRHDTTRHDTTRHDTTRHDTTRHDTTRHRPPEDSYVRPRLTVTD